MTYKNWVIFALGFLGAFAQNVSAELPADLSPSFASCLQGAASIAQLTDRVYSQSVCFNDAEPSLRTYDACIDGANRIENDSDGFRDSAQMDCFWNFNDKFPAFDQCVQKSHRIESVNSRSLAEAQCFMTFEHSFANADACVSGAKQVEDDVTSSGFQDRCRGKVSNLQSQL